jgi:hypothetical protein
MKLQHFLILLLFVMTSCNVLEKSQEIVTVLKDNCDCDDIRLVEYNWEDYKTTAHYEVVGCKFDSLETEQERVIQILKEQIDGFCDINSFTLDFINEMEHHAVTLRKCNR